MTIAWNMLKYLFPKNPRLRVMGLFGCTHKSIAVGVPLINALYGKNPSVGLYTLPLLIWHPMNLVVGTFLTPHLIKFVAREQEKYGLDTNDKPITLPETTADTTTSQSPPTTSTPLEESAPPSAVEETVPTADTETEKNTNGKDDTPSN
jgi:SBF-like CPA transporter family (DUF4137)